jgi:hypothetical protein
MYCVGSTPRFTTATGVQSLGFWATYMSRIRDVARFGWCWLAGHRRPAPFDSPGPNFTLTRLAGGQMTSGLLQRSDRYKWCICGSKSLLVSWLLGWIASCCDTVFAQMLLPDYGCISIQSAIANDEQTDSRCEWWAANQSLHTLRSCMVCNCCISPLQADGTATNRCD